MVGKEYCPERNSFCHAMLRKNSLLSTFQSTRLGTGRKSCWVNWTMVVRRQATLFLPSGVGDAVEVIRARLNPAQSRLIRAHVTLCREDEVADWDALVTRLAQIKSLAVDLSFTELVRNGNLVFATVAGSTNSFDEVRNALLSTETTLPRIHRPHITLIHPRNGKCDDATFAIAKDLFKPFSVRFNCITIIEQVDSGTWQEIAAFRCLPCQSANRRTKPGLQH